MNDVFQHCSSRLLKILLALPDCSDKLLNTRFVMFKWIKHIIAVVLLVFLLVYIGKHWRELEVLLNLRPIEMVLLYAVMGLATTNNSRVVQKLLLVLNIRASLPELILLQNAGRLLNYVPMKFGTMVRANYLKRTYGLSYTNFATMLLYVTVLMTAVAGIVGFTALTVGYGLGGYENKILGGLFLFILAGSLILAFIPLPVPVGEGRLQSIIRNFLLGRKIVTANKKVVIVSMVHFAGTFLLSSLRLAIIYKSMGQDMQLTGYLVLGVLGFASFVVAITPGALAVRELVLGCGALVLGIPFDVGVFAAVLDRAIMLSWTFVLGGASTFWLWHRYPADFKQLSPNVLTEDESSLT